MNYNDNKDKCTCTCCHDKWNKVCKGKDIQITLPIKIDGEAQDLSDKDLSVEVTDPMGHKTYSPYTVNGNEISFMIYGKEQKYIGIYAIRVWLNKDDEGQTVLDFTNAFELVRTTKEEIKDFDSPVQINTMPLTTNDSQKAHFDGEGVIVSEKAIFDGEGVILM